MLNSSEPIFTSPVSLCVSAVGCFHISGGQVAEQQLTGPPDPADLQVTRVTPLPLSVALRDPAGQQVTVEAELTSDRHRAVTTALVSALARAALQVNTGDTAGGGGG